MTPREQWLAVVRSEQQPDGSFRGWTSPLLHAAQPERSYATTFVTSQVVWALSAFRDEGMKDVIERATVFLRAQFLDGSMNYWSRGSEESLRLRLPDDLDDTACALAALVAADAAAKQDGELLGQVTRALIDCEKQPGGPFRTWRIHPQADAKWLDVDVAVNANVAFALSLLEVSLDPLWEYLDQAVQQWQFSSPYYPNRIPVLFFLSRLPRPAWREALVNAWNDLRLADGSWGNPLADALALISLRGLGVTEDSVRSRLAQSFVEGSHAFCLDPAQQGSVYYSGSPALEAAFRLLACHEERGAQATHASVKTDHPLHGKILQAVRKQLPSPETTAGQACESLVRRLDGFDSKRQITLTPFWVAQALGRDVSEDFLVRLGKANVFGWAAYTALDDVMDGDGGPELLPPAEIFLRRLSDEFSAIHPHKAEFQRWWRSILDRIDLANAEELATMRNPTSPPAMPEVRMFAERSLGHAIAPVAVMIECGHPLDSRETQALFEALRWYITARQLHDDAHDWETDLKRGQLNSASLRLAHPLAEGARAEFWTKAIVAHADEVFYVCKQGRACLAEIPFARPEMLTILFERIEQGTRDALEGRKQSLDFIQSMQGK